MKIARLELIAFGPFQDVVLDFDGEMPGLFVVHGRNEAGKSTTLRALEALLFGIDARTPDAHRHPYDKLQVGGVLVGADGQRLQIVRRKGNRRTLLGPDGEPIDEAVLQRLLGGVTRERFRNAFALDQPRLRSGAADLVAAGGEVGESLFDAGVGGRGVRRLLERLESEAAAIYVPQGKRRALNEALESFKSARRATLEAALSASSWREQNEAIVVARQRCEELRAERRRLGEERSRLEREQRLLPRLEQRRRLLAERAALGAAADSLLQVPDELIDDLDDRLAVARRDALERPRLEAELRATRRSIERQRAALGGSTGAGTGLDVATQARARHLSVRHAALVDAAREQRSRVTKAARRRAAAADEVQALPPPMDTAPLAAAHVAALGLGDAESRCVSAAEDVERCAERVREHAAAFADWSADVAALEALPVPDADTVDGLVLRLATLEQDAAAVGVRTREHDDQRRQVDQQLDALTRAGGVPTEAMLEAVRAEREARWRSLRSAGLQDAAAIAAFEAAQRTADDLADRLRREAGRVAHHAELIARRDAILRDLAADAAERRRIDAERATFDAAWRARWPASVPVEPPARMRSRLDRLAELRAALKEQRLATGRHERELERIADTRAALRTALTTAGETVEGAVPLAGLVALAAQRLEAAADTERQRDRLVGRLADREQAEADARVAATEAEQELAAWQVDWREVMARIGLAADLHPEQADALLERLAALAEEEHRALHLEQRLDELRATSEQLEGDVQRLISEHDAALLTLAVEERGTELLRRHREARRIQAELHEVEEAILFDAPETTIEALAQRLSGVRAEQGSARLDEVRADHDRIDDELQVANQDLGNKEQGLAHLADRSSAEKAAEAEGHLERVRHQADRYLRSRLAVILLRREIERYRQEHQGPILRRARELFARLTLGRYPELGVELDDHDQPVLRCVRADGEIKRVPGLSDGTRDQLYLALRIASLEHQAALTAPLPLVVDDLLIQFDDERARAALEVLGELAAVVQVLFFTHHARLVELATAAVPPDRLRVCDLDPLRA